MFRAGRNDILLNFSTPSEFLYANSMQNKVQSVNSVLDETVATNISAELTDSRQFSHISSMEKKKHRFSEIQNMSNLKESGGPPSMNKFGGIEKNDATNN